MFGGDHIYVMDINPMLAFHEDGGHDLTIAAFPVPLKEASRYGVLEVAADGRIVGFEEKPTEPRAIPGQPELALASMGNYVFRASVLIEALEHDALQDTTHDFGKNLIPSLLKGGARLYAYDFSSNRVPGNEDLAPYWRDVGTVDSYWDASMDLISVTPPLNLYNQKWPIKSHSPQLPPGEVRVRRRGLAAHRPRDGLAGRVGLHHLGRHDPPVDPLPAREDQLVLARRGVRPDGRRGRRAATRGSSASSPTRA